MRADGEQAEGSRFTSLETPVKDLGPARLRWFCSSGPPADVSPAHRTDVEVRVRPRVLLF